MLSIIISSYKDDLFSHLSENIKSTIGNLEYEIIRIYNPNLMSIAQAYNEGTSKSQFEFLLFLHEDVKFFSENWGNILIDKMMDKAIGLVGLAGASAKSQITSGWNTGYSRANYFNLRQGNKSQVSKVCNIVEDKEVVVIDGFFMATKKSIFKKSPFDENLIKGFHGYDLYLSLFIGNQYKLKLISGIDVLHFSIGSPDNQWFENNILINDFFQNSLPRYSESFSHRQKKEIEFQALKSIIKFNEIEKTENNVEYVRKLIFDTNTRNKIGIKNYLLISFYFYLRFKFKI